MKTGLVRRFGVRHSIRDRDENLTLCGMYAYREQLIGAEPTCKWCRDRLNLDPATPTPTPESEAS